MLENRLKTKETKFYFKKIYVYIVFLTIIIIGFIFNNISLGYYNSFGVKPRDISFSSIIGIFLSWTMHSDFNHLKNNMIILSQLLIPFIIFERKPLLKISVLISLSGLYVWLFGSDNSNHIGSSGLIFAIFSYMISSIIFNFKKRWIYLILVVTFGLELGIMQSLSVGLFRIENNISFAAHFGGFLVGSLYSFYINKK